MPDLFHSLQGSDLGLLHIIADLWGVDLEAPDVRRGRRNLFQALLDRNLIAEVVEALPEEARQALAELKSNAGRVPWSKFTQRYGELREMGPNRRDREQPHLKPSSTTEILWYRALVARAFFDAQAGAQEFAFVPEDLLALLPDTSQGETITLSRPAAPAERAHKRPADDRILDHAATLLAALRMGFDPDKIEDMVRDWEMPAVTLVSLLASAGLTGPSGEPLAEAMRAFLEARRGEALAQLAAGWLNSPDHNDLHHIPHLQPEGEWANDPLQTRHTVLEMLRNLEAGTWWSLPAFIASVKTHRPAFQRPAGDYDSWYLKDTRTGEYLRGFEHWEAVDGALLNYFITGPLHWLGMVDLAGPEEDASPAAFRFSRWWPALVEGQPPERLPEETESVHVDSQGRIAVPRLAPRSLRYQLARFGDWGGMKKGQYIYTLTPQSLRRAQSQGLQVPHLLSLLNKHADAKLPPSLVRALNRWQGHGAQARLESVLVLRLKHPEILQELRDSRAARYLGDPLGPAAVVVKPGAWERVIAALAEMGYLCEIATGEDQ